MVAGPERQTEMQGAPKGSRPILLPAEIRVREFDAKLLLACCLAERGLTCYLGQRTEIDLMAGRFPRSIYLAKGLTQQTRRHFVTHRNFGHEIVAWDEEAICYLTREIYYGRRLGDATVPLVSRLIAWGEDNAELWRETAERNGIPVHVLGNPRADLLREELRGAFEPETAEIRKRYGRFVLINSNFGSANNLIPEHTRFREGADPAELRGSDRIGYRPEQAQYKLDMFKRMLAVPEYLAREFPDAKIIVRPHPAENHGAWQEAARGHPNVEVVYEGSVLPWIAASACVVHSSCTTALEAFLLDVPAIALRYPGGHICDDDLPNLISYSATELEDLPLLIAPALAGELPPNSNGGKSRALLSRYIASVDGPLASDRIADLLATIASEPPPEQPPAAIRFLQHCRVEFRKVSRFANSWRTGHPAHPAWREHQFAKIGTTEVNQMIGDFSARLSRFPGVQARRIGERVFEVRNQLP